MRPKCLSSVLFIGSGSVSQIEEVTEWDSWRGNLSWHLILHLKGLAAQSKAKKYKIHWLNLGAIQHRVTLTYVDNDSRFSVPNSFALRGKNCKTVGCTICGRIDTPAVTNNRCSCCWNGDFKEQSWGHAEWSTHEWTNRHPCLWNRPCRTFWRHEEAAWTSSWGTHSPTCKGYENKLWNNFPKPHPRNPSATVIDAFSSCASFFRSL